MRRYSTSFTLAAGALPRRIRTHIEAVYAMVRVADELVDGAWTTGSTADLHRELDRFESVIIAAVANGFSTDLIAHAFARTARATGIGPRQWEPFFASMRSDIAEAAGTTPATSGLSPVAGPDGSGPAAAPASDPVAAPASGPTAEALSPDALARYVHGSAEVVGEMCVLVFLDGAPLPADAGTRLLPGARALGSAFQKVNFLRDIGHDSAALQRGYVVPAGRAHAEFTDAQKERMTAQVWEELATAAPAIPLLPRAVRPAVWTAFGVFAELNHRIATTPAAQVARVRIRVPDAVKLSLAARAVAGRPRTDWPGLDRAATVTPLHESSSSAQTARRSA